MTDVFLLWHISHALRANVSSTSTMTEALCATSKLVMMRNFWASTPSDAAAQARIESARTLPGFSDEPDCFHITLHTLGTDEWTEGFSIVE